MWSRKVLPRILPYLNYKPVIYKSVRNYSQVQTKIISENADILGIKVGEIHHGFMVKEIQEIPEFRIVAVYLLHDKTKTPYLHLHRNDNNNVFSINFRTTPLNSTGLPHILEHTVLCGSELFPVRDPFFKMLNRSLATFMNAMTGSDYTIYPFSSQNYRDYKNLQKIYLDAVFRPLLRELDFMQEGWRLENVDPNDIKTELTIKGVVYNEMKGALSENDSIFSQKMQNLILPDHTYGVISGGDPQEIPNLTWNDLKRFHVDHYHPSNARIYSYGNFPLIPNLEYINNEYLTKYAYSPMHQTEVPRQKRWKELQTAHITGPLDSGEPIEKQNSIAVSMLLTDNTDSYETFLMTFVTELLIRGPNSPFYKSLIEPNFSGGFTPSTGLDGQPRDAIFNIGIQKVKQEDFNKVLEIFEKTLDAVIEKGFEQDHIDSILHQYEISIKHETNNFGLNILFALSAMWNHTDKVIEALRVNDLLDKFKNELRNNPKYLQEVVKKYFKDNTHKLILSMSADPQYKEKMEKEEKKILKKKTKGLSESDKQDIFDKSQELIKEQEAPANANLLPTLVIDDINDDIEKVDKVQVTLNNVQTQINKVSSNGIVYFKSILNTTELSPEQQMLLPVFCQVVSKLGTDKLNYKEFDSLVSRKTGGLTFKSHVGDSLFHLHTYEPGVLISSFCLEKNIDAMWDLWNQIFTLSKLADAQRFQMLIQLYMANLKHGLLHSGHLYAMQAASSLVSGSAYQVELLSGLRHISYMKRLIDTSNYKAMLDELSNIATILFDKKKMRVALNISPENQTTVLRTYENFINNLPETNSSPEMESNYVVGKVWAPTDAVNCEHHIQNGPVNFCSKAILTTPYTSPDYAKLNILARLLTSKYLLPELREKSGAYGGGARLASDGVFSFYSYRDPRNVETLDVFDTSLKWLNDHIDKMTSQDVFEAKLGVFQSVDAPIPPSDKGNEEFTVRLSPDVKQRHRAELMSVSKDGLKEVAEKYLGESNVLNTGKVVIGSKSEKMDVSKRENELWTVLDAV